MLALVFDAKGDALKRERHDAAWLAHTTASLTAFAFHSPKKIPTLASLIGESAPPRMQSEDEMRAAFRAWAS